VGQRVRITAQLVDAANGYQLWSERYDRELGDIFAIQEAIAQTIVRRLEGTLASPSDGALVTRPTKSLEAYQLYLKGRYFSNQRGAGVAKALACYQEAIALDQCFAQAHAGVADAYTLLAFYGFRPSRDVMPQAKAAVERALALDDAIAEAHASNGLILWLYDWDWAAAERELKRAIALNPRYVDARHWYAALCASKLRLDKAVAEDQRALELEPLSVFAHVQMGVVLLMTGDTTQAIAQIRTAIELDPHFALAHWLLGCAHALETRYADALPALQAAVNLSHRLPSMVASLAAGYAEAGRVDEARLLLAELQARADRDYIPPGSVAVVFGALGETEEALRWLERACEARDVSLAFLRDRLDTAAGFSMPPAVRRDPRYHALLRKVGLTHGRSK
jgi:tetratricopeptide (TPR) repeat protein